jgi:hypothetical protein
MAETIQPGKAERALRITAANIYGRIANPSDPSFGYSDVVAKRLGAVAKNNPEYAPYFKEFLQKDNKPQTIIDSVQSSAEASPNKTRQAPTIANTRSKGAPSWDAQRGIWVDPSGQPSKAVAQPVGAVTKDAQVAQARVANQTKPPPAPPPSAPAATKSGNAAVLDEINNLSSGTSSGSNDIFSDPTKLASFFRSLSGGQTQTHRDAITANDVAQAEFEKAQSGSPAAKEAAYNNWQKVVSQYNSPENQSLIESLGGEQRVQDLQETDARDKAQANNDYSTGRQIFGPDAAAKMTQEELRTNVRNYYAGLQPASDARSSSQVVSDAVAAGRINPSGPTPSQEGQYGGRIGPATDFNTAFTPVGAASPSNTSAPTVGDMRNILQSSLKDVEPVSASPDNATVGIQPNQPPPPIPAKRPEDEETG